MKKVGDIVTIRGDIEIDKMYGSFPYKDKRNESSRWCFFIKSMSKYMNKRAKIVKAYCKDNQINASYSLDIDEEGYAWTEEMFNNECLDKANILFKLKKGAE